VNPCFLAGPLRCISCTGPHCTKVDQAVDSVNCPHGVFACRLALTGGLTGPTSGLVRRCPTLSDIVRRCPTLSNIVRCCPTLSDIVRHCPTLSYIVRHCQTLSDIVRHCQTLSDIVRHCPTFSNLWWVRNSFLSSSKNVRSFEDECKCKVYPTYTNHLCTYTC
jgi:hypothetical protein